MPEDITSAKEGETWVAKWFSGYGGDDDYIEKEFTVKSVKRGEVMTMDGKTMKIGIQFSRKHSGGKRKQASKKQKTRRRR